MDWQRRVRLRNGCPGRPVGLLLPNLLGFLGFTLFPVVFSFWMAFTNWTPKPAVKLAYLGLRNFTDLLGVRALDQPHPSLAWGYTLFVLLLAAGLVGALWANMAEWRGTRASGVLIFALGLALLYGAFFRGCGQGVGLLGIVALVCGTDRHAPNGNRRRPRLFRGCQAPAGSRDQARCLRCCWWAARSGSRCSTRQCGARMRNQDARFWQYAYNTAYLMIGIPFSIAGSLLLALLLNDDLPVGAGGARLIGAALCALGGLISLVALWGSGHSDLGLLAAILWAIAALGIGFNVVAFRTLFYLPTSPRCPDDSLEGALQPQNRADQHGAGHAVPPVRLAYSAA